MRSEGEPVNVDALVVALEREGWVFRCGEGDPRVCVAERGGRRLYSSDRAQLAVLVAERLRRAAGLDVVRDLG
jgi:hypothetical protein